MRRPWRCKSTLLSAPIVTERDLYAAVDLGSNSFHLIVATVEHGELRVIDQIKDMVRLGGGLDARRQLDLPTRQRALECLARFAQRIAGVPDTQVRAVGTQTFRRMRNAAEFVAAAEATLGCPIDIVSGREEARLIYAGVSQGLVMNGTRRLLIDIGGGSTELMVGDRREPEMVESLPFGCVSVTQQAFPEGELNERRWQRHLDRLIADLQALPTPINSIGWSEVVGSSGTLRAIVDSAQAIDPERPAQITPAVICDLRERIIAAGHIDAVSLPGLSSQRQPVISGGVMVAEAVMQAFGIEAMTVSDRALREGVLQDLMGRLAGHEHRHDPRHATVNAMAERYGCDRAQAARVADWADAAFVQVATDWQLNARHRELLSWACHLHEIGLSIAHDRYPQHSGYILAHADLPGFSRQEQQFMAVLVGQQRGKPDTEVIEALPARLQLAAIRVLALLRLAVLFNRSRQPQPPPTPTLTSHRSGRKLLLALPPGWLASHPLTRADLEQEQDQWHRLKLKLRIDEPEDHKPENHEPVATDHHA